jgi:hypothetical protein
MRLCDNASQLQASATHKICTNYTSEEGSIANKRDGYVNHGVIESGDSY